MMAFGVPLAELGWLAAAVVIAGIVTGLLAGLFGIGGGAIIVVLVGAKLDATINDRLYG